MILSTSCLMLPQLLRAVKLMIDMVNLLRVTLVENHTERIVIKKRLFLKIRSHVLATAVKGVKNSVIVVMIKR